MTKVKDQITKTEVNVVYLQAKHVLAAVTVHGTGLERNVVKVGGQINRVE